MPSPNQPPTIAGTLTLLWRYSQGRRVGFFVVSMMALVLGQLMVAGPVLMSEFFGVFTANTPQNSSAYLSTPLSVRLPLAGASLHLPTMPAFAVLLCAVAATLFFALISIFQGVLEERFQQSMLVEIKTDVYQGMQRSHVVDPMRPTGELMEAVSSHPLTLVVMMSVLIVQPLLHLSVLIGATSAMAARSGVLTVIYLLTIAFFGLILPRLLGFEHRVVEAASELRDAGMNQSRVLQEQLEARDMVDAVDAERAATARVRDTFLRYKQAQIRLALRTQMRSLSSPLIAVSFPVLILVSAALGASDPSTLVLLITLYLPVTAAGESLVSHWTAWKQSGPSLSVLTELLRDRAPELNNQLAVSSPPEVCLNDVSAHLPDGSRILDGLSLSVPAGSLTALVGRGGSGKSVTLDVLSGRFTGTVRGTISLSGELIEAAELVSYRHHFARLNQFPSLLSVSVSEYVSFGTAPLSNSSLRTLLDRVGLGDSAPPERRLQPNDVIGGNRRLSGFQRQALRLAQLLARDPKPVILLDEPDSAMSRSDATLIQRVLRDDLAGHSTVILVTHAPDLLPDDIPIHLLDSGKVVASGNHRELTATSGVYRSMIEELSSSADSEVENQHRS